MRCPFCSNEDTQVVDTRSNEGTNVIPVSYTHLTLPTILRV